MPVRGGGSDRRGPGESVLYFGDMPSSARSLLLAAGAVLALAGVLAGCGASDRRFGRLQRTASPILRLAAGPPAHIAVIVMENEEYGDIIGSRATPFINRLARSLRARRGAFLDRPSRRCPTTWR